MINFQVPNQRKTDQQEMKNMSYFTQEYLDFFQELADNNNKEWFHAHRKDYENFVREPFKAFVSDMILFIREEDPELDISPKDAIFRINKDIRFSKDKRPYKLHMAANICQGGRVSADSPGFYFQFSPEFVMIGGGAYHVDREGLSKIRTRIANSQEEFSELIQDQVFKEHYGEVQGEKNKRLPKEFQAPAELQPLIFNKHFYFMTELEPALLLEEDLPQRLMDHYRAGKGLNLFLKSALQG